MLSNAKILTRAILSGSILLGMAFGALAQAPAPKPAPPKPAATAKPPTPAPAPAAAPAAPAPAASAAPAPDDGQATWIKICGTEPTSKKKICSLNTERRGDNGALLASLQLQQIAGQDKYGVGIVLPLGVFLPKGIELLVDGKKLATAGFLVCVPPIGGGPPGCIAQAAAEASLVDALKKGKKFELGASMAAAPNDEIKIEISIAGFAKVFDSEGLDETQAKKKQDEMNAAVQKLAEERRKRLIEEQNKAKK